MGEGSRVLARSCGRFACGIVAFLAVKASVAPDRREPVERRACGMPILRYGVSPRRSEPVFGVPTHGGRVNGFEASIGLVRSVGASLGCLDAVLSEPDGAGSDLRCLRSEGDERSSRRRAMEGRRPRRGARDRRASTGEAGDASRRRVIVGAVSHRIAVLAAESKFVGDDISSLVQITTLITFIISSYVIVLRYPTPIAVSDRLRRD